MINFLLYFIFSLTAFSGNISQASNDSQRKLSYKEEIEDAIAATQNVITASNSYNISQGDFWAVLSKKLGLKSTRFFSAKMAEKFIAENDLDLVNNILVDLFDSSAQKTIVKETDKSFKSFYFALTLIDLVKAKHEFKHFIDQVSEQYKSKKERKNFDYSIWAENENITNKYFLVLDYFDKFLTKTKMQKSDVFESLSYLESEGNEGAQFIFFMLDVCERNFLLPQNEIQTKIWAKDDFTLKFQKSQNISKMIESMILINRDGYFMSSFALSRLLKERNKFEEVKSELFGEDPNFDQIQLPSLTKRKKNLNWTMGDLLFLHGIRPKKDEHRIYQGILDSLNPFQPKDYDNFFLELGVNDRKVKNPKDPTFKINLRGDYLQRKRKTKFQFNQSDLALLKSYEKSVDTEVSIDDLIRDIEFTGNKKSRKKKVKNKQSFSAKEKENELKKSGAALPALVIPESTGNSSNKPQQIRNVAQKLSDKSKKKRKGKARKKGGSSNKMKPSKVFNYEDMQPLSSLNFEGNEKPAKETTKNSLPKKAKNTFTTDNQANKKEGVIKILTRETKKEQPEPTKLSQGKNKVRKMKRSLAKNAKDLVKKSKFIGQAMADNPFNMRIQQRLVSINNLFSIRNTANCLQRHTNKLLKDNCEISDQIEVLKTETSRLVKELLNQIDNSNEQTQNAESMDSLRELICTWKLQAEHRDYNFKNLTYFNEAGLNYELSSMQNILDADDSLFGQGNDEKHHLILYQGAENYAAKAMMEQERLNEELSFFESYFKFLRACKTKHFS